MIYKHICTDKQLLLPVPVRDAFLYMSVCKRGGVIYREREREREFVSSFLSIRVLDQNGVFQA